MMSRNRVEDGDFRCIAEELGTPVAEVRRAVYSFFGVIKSESRKLPFDDGKKIYTKKKFLEYERAWNIPRIGRIGTVYSRYLKWRENEAKDMQLASRSDYRSRRTQDDIEHMAEAILSGGAPFIAEKRKGSEMYDRVWLVGQDGKTLARQVIPKK